MLPLTAVGAPGRGCEKLVERGQKPKTSICRRKATKFAMPLALAMGSCHFTHRGVLLGHFDVGVVVQNVGQLPKMTTMDGDPSEWQIKPDRWVAVCVPPFHKLEETLYHEAFRGWRYFNVELYRHSLGAKVRI